MKRIAIIVLLLVLLIALIVVGYEVYANIHNENVAAYYDENFLDRAYIKNISKINSYIEDELAGKSKAFNSLKEVKDFFAGIETTPEISNNIDKNRQLTEIKKLEYVESAIYSYSSAIAQEISEELLKKQTPIYVGIYSNIDEIYNDFSVRYNKEYDKDGINIKLIYSPISSMNQSYILILPLEESDLDKTVKISSQKNSESNEYMPSIYWNLVKLGSEPLAKPVIYIYPKEETQVTVSLSNPDVLTHTYPKYIDGWKVLAKPNGDLVDITTGRNLYCLYWESMDNTKINMSEGFIVKGEDITAFLEEKLRVLGLSDKEANEFIIYWLPKLESNIYNYIRFRTKDEINGYMKLNINPTPDTVIRVIMDFKALDKPINIKQQELQSVIRKGYTVVEWGAREIK